MTYGLRNGCSSHSLVRDQRHSESALVDFPILRLCCNSTRTSVRVMTRWSLALLIAGWSVAIEMKSTALPRDRGDNFWVATFVTSRTTTCEETA